eukprot:CAMPEP_0178964086 /NCGR_PEP_ID=MMETSP0789-20121207/15438_1 /TAXON_ID=3005 /ORGANISM="Rhizosolenia setigera, Strain CCMP 1694" /LENGTH=161 /DNA_ID=CAMNT_0020648735 /DNA_START=69 /DNA_END=554 /DNA_ORIENTATION=-
MSVKATSLLALFAAVIFLCSENTTAYVTPSSSVKFGFVTTTTKNTYGMSNTFLKSSPLDENNSETSESSSVEMNSDDSSTSSDVPLDVPSPILLASSMVLAIASTGSVFDLIGGNTPAIGFIPAAAVAVLGLPTCLFLFYAAVKKGMAETEEDDAKYSRRY